MTKEEERAFINHEIGLDKYNVQKNKAYILLHVHCT